MKTVFDFLKERYDNFELFPDEHDWLRRKVSALSEKILQKVSAMSYDISTGKLILSLNDKITLSIFASRDELTTVIIHSAEGLEFKLSAYNLIKLHLLLGSWLEDS